MSPQLRTAVGRDDHTSGAADAAITLVEYGDYECPHCARAALIVEAVRKEMGEELRFVFRHFPLTEIHPHAMHAAEAAESVNAQVGDKGFWDMHHAIFSHQHAIDDAALGRYAATAGADTAKTFDDLKSDAFVERVQSDFTGGVRSGVNGTPTFFINGARFDGDWSDEDSFMNALKSGSRER